jgi:hypothetical protein
MSVIARAIVYVVATLLFAVTGAVGGALVRFGLNHTAEDVAASE